SRSKGTYCQPSACAVWRSIGSSASAQAAAWRASLRVRTPSRSRTTARVSPGKPSRCGVTGRGGSQASPGSPRDAASSCRSRSTATRSRVSRCRSSSATAVGSPPCLPASTARPAASSAHSQLAASESVVTPEASRPGCPIASWFPVVPGRRLSTRTQGMGIVGKVAASAALGSSLSDRARLGVYHARIALANRLPLPPPGTVTAAIRPDGRRVIVGDAGELAVLHAVLVDEEYADDRPPPDVVVDLGANAGFATLFFKRRYPHARVVAVEADPRAYARLVQNVGTLEGVTTFHCAVAAEDGTMPFYCSPLSSIGSSLDRRSPGDEEVPIEALTLSSLL